MVESSHGHRFNSGSAQAERRTRIVVALTLTMMIAEIAGGLVFGSMALLADGWHMGTHAAALGVALLAYLYARRHDGDATFTFGTGKVGVLGGFASAVGLAIAAVLMGAESLHRLFAPTRIRFDEAIAVAVVGLLVNLASAALLRERHGHGDDHNTGGKSRDYNLKAAYLHVLADALTSVLAIAALSVGKLAGLAWLDPLMGIVGSLVITRWAVGLLRDTSAILLDRLPDPELLETARTLVEGDGAKLLDLHLWRLSEEHLAAELVILGEDPLEPEEYRRRLQSRIPLAHVTVEVHRKC